MKIREHKENEWFRNLTSYFCIIQQEIIFVLILFQLVLPKAFYLTHPIEEQGNLLASRALFFDNIMSTGHTLLELKDAGTKGRVELIVAQNFKTKSRGNLMSPKKSD